VIQNKPTTALSGSGTTSKVSDSTNNGSLEITLNEMSATTDKTADSLIKLNTSHESKSVIANSINIQSKVPTSLKDGCIYTASMLIEKVRKLKRQVYDPEKYNPSLIFSNGLEHYTLLDCAPLKIGYDTFPNPSGVVGNGSGQQRYPLMYLYQINLFVILTFCDLLIIISLYIFYFFLIY
jgi:hypothetical protein